MPKNTKQHIEDRFTTHREAKRYRDRYLRGKRRRTHERETAALKTALSPLPRVERVLDVGSGAGRFNPVLLEHCSRLIQTDISRPMLDVSRETYPLPGARSRYVLADVKALPFAEGAVDLVFCHRLLNHLPDRGGRRLAMRNLAAVSRRFVVFSCLGPLSVVRAVRRGLQRLRRRETVDGHVEAEDLLADAADCGLVLQGQTPIRALGTSSHFFTFVKKDASGA